MKKTKKIPEGWTASDVKWSEDFEAIKKAAKKYGVCEFLNEVERRKLPIDKYVQTGRVEIVHHVNGWDFIFRFGTGELEHIH